MKLYICLLCISFLILSNTSFSINVTQIPSMTKGHAIPISNSKYDFFQVDNKIYRASKNGQTDLIYGGINDSLYHSINLVDDKFIVMKNVGNNKNPNNFLSISTDNGDIWSKLNLNLDAFQIKIFASQSQYCLLFSKNYLKTKDFIKFDTINFLLSNRINSSDLIYALNRNNPITSGDSIIVSYNDTTICFINMNTGYVTDKNINYEHYYTELNGNYLYYITKYQDRYYYLNYVSTDKINWFKLKKSFIDILGLDSNYISVKTKIEGPNYLIIYNKQSEAIIYSSNDFGYNWKKNKLDTLYKNEANLSDYYSFNGITYFKNKSGSNDLYYLDTINFKLIKITKHVPQKVNATQFYNGDHLVYISNKIFYYEFSSDSIFNVDMPQNFTYDDYHFTLLSHGFLYSSYNETIPKYYSFKTRTSSNLGFNPGDIRETDNFYYNTNKIYDFNFQNQIDFKINFEKLRKFPRDKISDLVICNDSTITYSIERIDNSSIIQGEIYVFIKSLTDSNPQLLHFYDFDNKVNSVEYYHGSKIVWKKDSNIYIIGKDLLTSHDNGKRWKVSTYNDTLLKYLKYLEGNSNSGGYYYDKDYQLYNKYFILNWQLVFSNGVCFDFEMNQTYSHYLLSKFDKIEILNYQGGDKFSFVGMKDGSKELYFYYLKDSSIEKTNYINQFATINASYSNNTNLFYLTNYNKLFYFNQSLKWEYLDLGNLLNLDISLNRNKKGSQFNFIAEKDNLLFFSIDSNYFKLNSNNFNLNSIEKLNFSGKKLSYTNDQFYLTDSNSIYEYNHISNQSNLSIQTNEKITKFDASGCYNLFIINDKHILNKDKSLDLFIKDSNGKQVFQSSFLFDCKVFASYNTFFDHDFRWIAEQAFPINLSYLNNNYNQFFVFDSTRLKLVKPQILSVDKINKLNNYLGLKTTILSNSVCEDDDLRIYPCFELTKGFIASFNNGKGFDLLDANLFKLSYPEYFKDQSQTYPSFFTGFYNNGFLSLCDNNFYLANGESKTGIETEETQINSVFSIYPNPTTDFINIKPYSLSPERIQIYSMLGEEIINQEFTNKVDISGLASGNYIIKIGTQVVKFIKL